MADNIKPTQLVMPALPAKPPKNEQQEKDKQEKHQQDEPTSTEQADHGLFDEYV